MTDKSITERELILPSLYIMAKYSGAVTTAQLIKELTQVLKPSGVDAEILNNRNDSHFSQKVRNLKSHDTLEKAGFANYIGKNVGFRITPEGRAFLLSNIDTTEYLISNNFNYEDIKTSFVSVIERAEKGKKPPLIYDENILIEEGTKKRNSSIIYERSRKLRDLAVSSYTDNGHISCIVCFFDFYNFYGELGKGFIEIHHKKPIFQYEDVETTKFIEEALKNVVPVCPNCHRMIHKERKYPLQIEELKAVIQASKKSIALNPS